jgi:hypothetical protein
MNTSATSMFQGSSRLRKRFVTVTVRTPPAVGSRPRSRAQHGCRQRRSARTPHPRCTASVKPYTRSGLPSEVRPPRQQSRIEFRAQFLKGTFLPLPQGPIQSILLGRNRFRASLMDNMYYPSDSLRLLSSLVITGRSVDLGATAADGPRDSRVARPIDAGTPILLQPSRSPISMIGPRTRRLVLVTGDHAISRSAPKLG